MTKFIKLTATVGNIEIYLNAGNIIGFYKAEKGTFIIVKLYAVKEIQRDLGFLVKESPEAIMSIINCINY